jgi:hypothetical protein
MVSASESAKGAALAVTSFTNLMAAFASPRLHPKLNPATDRAFVIRTIDKLLECAQAPQEHPLDASAPSKRLVEMRAIAVEMRLLFERWAPEEGVTSEIVQKARACLSTLGVAAPPEGWDRFEGWPEP